MTSRLVPAGSPLAVQFEARPRVVKLSTRPVLVLFVFVSNNVVDSSDLKVLVSVENPRKMGERRGMKALELWCRRVTQGYPGVKVENMTTSWRDGLAFCAIIHHFRPDLIDFSRLDKSDIYGNNELAFRTAERHLGIPSLLDAEDMLEYPVPDRLSILTYLSLFYQAFASNGSSPVKRSPETPDGSLMLVSPNVQPNSPKGSVGRGREPCVVCNLPVFIAQRLRISSKLYHRTCFRCARCDTQLSPADCYETLNGQFCCETCPDEMKEEEEPPPPISPEPQPELPAETKVKPEPPEPPPTIPKPSLVGLRKMMFESYAKDTDDAKLKIVDPSALQGSFVNSCLDSSVKDLPFKDDPNSDNQLSEEDHVIVDCVNKDVIYNVVEPESHFSIGETYESFTEVNVDEFSPKKEEEILEAVPKENETAADVVEESVTACVNQVLIDSVLNHENSISEIDSEKDNLASSDSLFTEAINSTVIYTSFIEPECDNSSKIDNEEVSEIVHPKVEEEGTENAFLTSESVAPKAAICEENVVVSPKTMNISEVIVEVPPKITNISEVIVEVSPKITNISDEIMETSPKVITEGNVEFSPKSIDTCEDSVEVSQKATTNELEEHANIQTLIANPLIYPEDLNPFGDDDVQTSTNPFGSDNEDEVKVEKVEKIERKLPPDQNLNPFWSEGEEEVEEEEPKRKPVPLPRRTMTPEPSPMPRSRLRSSGRSIGSVSSLARKKKPAPPPPSPAPSTLSSYPTTPRIRKARRAPLPPGQSTPNRSESTTPSREHKLPINELSAKLKIYELNDPTVDEPEIPPRKVKEDTELKIDQVEKYSSPVENERIIVDIKVDPEQTEEKSERPQSVSSQRRLIIPVAIKDSAENIPGLLSISKDESYRSLTSTSSMSIPDDISYQDDLSSPPSEKKHKDSANQQMKTNEEGSGFQRNKSTFGQWKRKKGPAPSVPFPERRPLKPMPILKLKQELEDIEVKQQGLERQGVSLEKKIRLKFTSEASVTPYVEELVLQLFELVNEKNELFRRQAELMYLSKVQLEMDESYLDKLFYMRRQYHLEEEHAELEYQIRCLMARPEANKTDSDKELEELLIQRLVEVVERRDAIVQCLERDRIREAEEDKSVNAQLNKFSEAMGAETLTSKIIKKSKKVKKEKQKELHSTFKTVDLDKDLDESEKEQKKKKKWFTMHQTKTKH